MKEITIQVFNRKEVEEILKKYPDRDLRKVQIIDEIVEDPKAVRHICGMKVKPTKGKAYKANTVFFLEEYIRYPTALNIKSDGTVETCKNCWWGKAHKIFREE
ncbi:MAG: hypothetical protein MJZ20_06880 [Bacteroidaceae bacterium]|nr:hypothetical protein [Bacteroidaceae bacterium]